jgi:hypothetical protein
MKISKPTLWLVPLILGITGVVLLATARPSVTHADIVFPQGVTGTVTVNGSAASNSAIVTVEMGGKECPTFPSEVHPDSGVYFLLISWGGDCLQPGSVVFKVNGSTASNPIVFGLADPTRTVNLALPFVASSPSPATVTPIAATPAATATGTPAATATASPATSASGSPTPLSTVRPSPIPTSSPRPNVPRAFVPSVSRD